MYYDYGSAPLIKEMQVKKVIAAVLGALFMAGSVVTVADAGSIKIPFANGAQEQAHGAKDALGLSNSTTLVKAGSGYVAEFCNVAGTGAVTIYDSATTGGAASTNELWTVGSTTTGACTTLELPYNSGLVITVAASTTIAVSYR